MGFNFPHGVEGYLDYNEGEFLYWLAQRAGPGAVVELGSYKGRSTICLAQGCRDNVLDTYVYAVDHFEGEPLLTNTYADYQSGNYEEALAENLREADVWEWVLIKKGPTHEVCVDKPVSLIFIDADHSYEAVKKDWVAWSTSLGVWGVAAFHDREIPGVANLLAEIHPDYRVYLGPGALAIVEKR